MEKSPGHREHPEHEVREERLRERVRIQLDGEVVADSDDVIELHEDRNPTRYYFPRSDVAMDKLEASDRDARCPFKGRGRYFDVKAGGETVEEAAWSYEDVYEEHRDLEDRIAFHDREMDSLELVRA